VGDFINSLFGGGSGGGTAAPTGSSGGGGDFLSSVGTALSDVGQLFGSGANAQTVPTGNDASSPAIDPALLAAASTTPPASASPQGDPTGIGGTLSGPQSGGQGQGQQKQGPTPADQQYAPDSAVAQLRKALEHLSRQRPNTYQFPPAQPQTPLRQAAMTNTDPSIPLPNLSPGETGPQSPPMLPMLERGETGPQSPVEAPFDPQNPPTPPARPTDLVGDPAEARIPPGAANAPSTVGGAPLPQTDDQGRQIVVKKPGAGAAPDQTGKATEEREEPADQPDLPTKPPTRKPGPEPGPIMRDVTGGQSVPSALPQLARLAMGLMPILAMAAASGGFGGGRRGGFGGFRHHGGQGHWPYFHPRTGWQFHDWHPGSPWMPMHPRHMRAFFRPGQQGYGQDPNLFAQQILSSMFGQGPQGQGGQQPGGGYPQGMFRGGPEGGGGAGVDYRRSGNPFTDSLTSIESPQGNVVSRSDQDSQGRTLREGGDPEEISQGFFQIQNYRNGGTWGRYAALAGVTAASPMQASYEDQHKVARLIPIREWGHRTKAQLHQRFGSFPEGWTLGQLEDYFGQGKVASTVAPQGKPNDDARAMALQ
jgi:hypothetical protein